LINTVSLVAEMGISATQDARNGVRDLIRTIWLASLLLATLGGLFAVKVVSATVAEPVEAAAAPMTGTGSRQDTLKQPDRIAVSYILPLAEKEPATAEPEPIKPGHKVTIVRADRRPSIARSLAVPLPRARPRSMLANNGKGLDRMKSASDLKSCRQQDAIARFLASAGISMRCET
jgi:hypothetical protein